MGKPGRSDSSGLSHIERFLLRGNRLRVHVFGAFNVHDSCFYKTAGNYFYRMLDAAKYSDM